MAVHEHCDLGLVLIACLHKSSQTEIIKMPMSVDAARCVKCGLCLAQCPTYQRSANEALSPRGRIALIQALQSGQVSPDKRSHEILHDCLLCRRCETQCPSDVPFGRIMDQGRAITRGQNKLMDRLTAALVTHPRTMRGLVGLGRVLLPRKSAWGRILADTTTSAAGHQQLAGGRKTPGRKVGLFVGCTGNVFDRATIDAAKKLLRQSGVEVVIPSAQGCCGAIAGHSGNAELAKAFAEKNEQAFAAADNLEAVLSIATGCGAYLADYARLGALHMDVCGFLAQDENISRLDFRPLEKVAALHFPCSQVNVLRSDDAMLKLLRKIPNLRIEPLGEKGTCCGAGGSAFLRPSQMALSLRKPLLEQVAQQEPDYVLSSNISCRLHLRGGDENTAIQYIHPLTLLAQQLIKQ